MIINGIDMEDIKKLEFTYDNLHLLDICKYLLGVIINDIEYMNNDIELYTEKEYFNLGNNTKIKNEDYESLCSILDTINFIEDYNKGVN